MTPAVSPNGVNVTSHRRTAAAFLAALSLFIGCSDRPPLGTGPDQRTQFLMIDATCDSAGCAIDVGSEWVFTALIVNSDGSRQPVAATWTSDNPAVLTVDPDGRVRALSAGTTMVRARVWSLTNMKPVQVLGKPLGPWKGEWVVRSCKASGRFERWCADFYRIAGRFNFDLQLREDSGRLSGRIAIERSGEGLVIDESSSLDSDGHLLISARGEAGSDFIGPFWASIDPLRAQIRGALMEGSFVMRVFGFMEGELVLEADLDRVTMR